MPVSPGECFVKQMYHESCMSIGANDLSTNAIIAVVMSIVKEGNLTNFEETKLLMITIDLF